MTKLSETESLDEFAARFVNELGLNGKVKVAQASELFPPGVLDFLRFAFEYESGRYRGAIEFKKFQDWGYTSPRFPVSENIKTLVYYVTTPPNRRTEDDPLLLLVLRERKNFSRPSIQRLANETFGNGASWSRATPQDLEYVGMLPNACHAFPEIKERMARRIHLWMDEDPHTTRHALYLPGSRERIGFMLVNSQAYAEIMMQRMPETFKREKIGFHYT